jgi:hypothetical protein
VKGEIIEHGIIAQALWKAIWASGTQVLGSSDLRRRTVLRKEQEMSLKRRELWKDYIESNQINAKYDECVVSRTSHSLLMECCISRKVGSLEDP